MESLIAFPVALLATPLAGALARRLGILDQPGELKVHTRSVPYLGGLAVMVAVVAGIATHRLALAAPAAAALAIGLVDDVRTLSPRARLAGEVAVGLVTAVVVDTDLPLAVHVGLALAATVLLINAVNLVDGLDGLAGGVGLASAAGFALVLGGDARAGALALAAALGGFLVFNRPPARIYLGDGGAYAVGALLATLFVSCWSAGVRPAVAIAAPLLVVVPVLDTAVAIIRRVRAGRPLFTGDRGHVYDQLVDRGMSAPRASLAMGVAQAALAGAAWVGAEAGPGPALGVDAVVAGVLAAVIVAGGFLSTTYRQVA